jgi:prefoldin subunit 5
MSNINVTYYLRRRIYDLEKENEAIKKKLAELEKRMKRLEGWHDAFYEDDKD